MNDEFKRLELVATEYFGGFSNLARLLNKNRSNFYFYKENKFGKKYLMDFKNIGINPDYITKGEGKPLLTFDYIDEKSKNKYLKLHDFTKEPETEYDLENKEILHIREQSLKRLATIPIYDVPAHANEGTLVTLEDLPVSYKDIKLESSIVNRENLAGMYIKGNSMIGEGLVEGTLVVFDVSKSPKDGDHVVVNLNGCIMVKLYENQKLYSVPYPDKKKEIEEYHDDNGNIIGVIIERYFHYRR